MTCGWGLIGTFSVLSKSAGTRSLTPLDTAVVAWLVKVGPTPSYLGGSKEWLRRQGEGMQ